MEHYHKSKKIGDMIKNIFVCAWGMGGGGGGKLVF